MARRVLATCADHATCVQDTTVANVGLMSHKREKPVRLAAMRLLMHSLANEKF
jgi:hypothetical protein